MDPDLQDATTFQGAHLHAIYFSVIFKQGNIFRAFLSAFSADAAFWNGKQIFPSIENREKNKTELLPHKSVSIHTEASTI